MDAVNYGVNKSVEFCVSLSQSFNFVDRVEDSGVMFAPEYASNFGQRRLRQLLNQEHRNLPRVSDLPSVRLLLELVRLELESLGYSAQHGVHCELTLLPRN